MVVRLPNRPAQNAIISSLDRLAERNDVEVTFRDEGAKQNAWAPLNFNGEKLVVDAREVTNESENLLLAVSDRKHTPSHTISNAKTWHSIVTLTQPRKLTKPILFSVAGQFQSSVWPMWPAVSRWQLRHKIGSEKSFSSSRYDGQAQTSI